MYASRYEYIASLPQGGICAEVGVQHGRFSAHILATAQPVKLHLIDRSFRKFLHNPVAHHPNIALHEGDSAETLASFPDAHFDWVYIDAGHEYKDVRRDATEAAKKVKPGGQIIFNDYIIWSHHEGFAYGVVQTVNEMCVNEGWEMVAFCLHENMYCDVAIRRRGS
jgi:predicted O-methyltransferase YrrM